MQRSVVTYRVIAAALLVLVVPLVVGLGAASDERPVREGEPAPATIFAEMPIQFVDREATDTARRTAAASVEPVLDFDRDAQGAIVRDVREVFAAVRQVREPLDPEADPPRPPTVLAQRELLTELAPELGEELVVPLVALSDGDLEVVERETIAIAQELARQPVEEDELETLISGTVPIELALRSLPGDSGSEVVRPLIELKMRPTVTVDPDATDARRERAAEAVNDVVRSWRPGEAIVRQGDVVQPWQYRAIEQLGLTGASPWRAMGRAVLAMLLVTLVAGIYLGRMQPRVWGSGTKLVLLGLLTTAYSGLVVAAGALTTVTSVGWLYAVPAGALAMLVALLIHPVVGIATMLPAAVMVLLVAPAAAPVAIFAAAAVLVSVPLTTRIAKRSDLRSATLRAGLFYPLLAAVLVMVFGPRDQLFVAIGAGVLNGIVAAIAVQGAMPFLETMFRLPTVTALLDLADRNHPLLRELETKALGSYNHSVMVASLTERACRAIGADPLLGSVAALYHDIGKVRQPHFFIENQQGIANPHDELEPEVSAIIIQNHVIDGVEMATEHRLPPEVVACIGSHHGTMMVSYFYEKAVLAAGGDEELVEADRFRYKGSKPRSKEAAVLLLADCSEATTRAMAMSRGTLPRAEIEQTVDRLLTERIDDGQFVESELTFRELSVARDTIVESLVGIYHPRIAYPTRSERAAETRSSQPTPAAGS
jgi:cyclic-di-AMP phosphodiesterase PgpH